MKIYKSLAEFDHTAPIALTQGTFDGLHRGHKIILNRLKEEAEKADLQAAVLTFFPHPRMVLEGYDNSIKLLHTEHEKIQAIGETGIDHLLIVPFTREFSELSPEEYMNEILIGRLNVELMVAGYDHRFGKDRKGTIELLGESGNIKVVEIEPQLINDIAVSSTKIRNSLLEGKVKQANEYLGYNYELNGIVAHGHKVGRDIGFPTANVSLAENYKLIPADGIYAVRVKVGDAVLKGALSIGTQPTFEGRKHAIEVHIIDFNEDIYGQEITLQFADQIRGEEKFESVDSLVQQIGRDVALAKKLLES